MNWFEIFGAFGAGIILGAIRGYSARLYWTIILCVAASLLPLTIIGWALQVPPVEPDWLQAIADVAFFLIGKTIGDSIISAIREGKA